MASVSYDQKSVTLPAKARLMLSDVYATMEIDNQHFAYVDRGSGSNLLFLHGALGDVRTFSPHCQILSSHFRCITYSQRYFGAEPLAAAGPPFGVETHAQDLVGFIEKAGLTDVNLLGWSYAGHVALRALQLRPDLFAAALLYETGFQTFMTDPQAIAAFRADNERIFGPVVAAVKAGDNAEAARRLVNGSVDDDGYFDRLPEARRTVYLENAHMMPRLLAQSPPPKIRADDLAAIPAPITIACGEKSPPAYRLISDAAMQILRGPHHLIADAGHFWPEDDVDGFCGLVKTWAIHK